MKKYLIITGVLSLLVISSVALAEEQNPMKPGPRVPGFHNPLLKNRPLNQGPMNHQMRENIRGVIAEVNDNSYTIEYTDKEGNTVTKTVNFNDKTKFKVRKERPNPEPMLLNAGRSLNRSMNTPRISGGPQATSADFKVDDTIRVMATIEGDSLTAMSVHQAPTPIKR